MSGVQFKAQFSSLGLEHNAKIQVPLQIIFFPENFSDHFEQIQWRGEHTE